MDIKDLQIKLHEIKHDVFYDGNIPIENAQKIRKQLDEVIEIVKNLGIPNVSISLPDDFWYSDENGNEVHLVGIVKDWCVVENRITEDTWVEPFEFVNALYNESLKGNEC